MKFTAPSSEFANKFWKMIVPAESIVITSHTSPDDDSIGSSLAVYWMIRDKFTNKKIKVLYTGEKDDRYDYFEGYDQVLFFPDIIDNLGDADLLIGLDGTQFSRFTKDGDKLKKFTGKAICIDHHSSPPDKFDLILCAPDKSATCQIIYESFYIDQDISKRIAESLLLGLLGDSGNFTYLRPSDIAAFDMGKRLVGILQVPMQEFKGKYDVISPRVFDAIKELMSNTKLEKLPGWDNYSWTYLSREFVEREAFSDNILSEASHIYMSNFVRTISNHPWGFVITPKSDGGCNVSFRSLPGSVNTRAIVEEMKVGGGHDRAAGSTFKSKGNEKIDPLSCYEKIKNWMTKNNQPVS